MSTITGGGGREAGGRGKPDSPDIVVADDHIHGETAAQHQPQDTAA